MEEKPYWDLPRRIEAWNLIYNFACTAGKERCLRQPSIEFVVTAYLYCDMYFQNRDESNPPKMDLFHVVFCACCVTAKWSKMLLKLNDIIYVMFRTTGINKPNTTLLGDDVYFLKGKIDPASANFKQFHSKAKQREMDFLEGIDWTFISESTLGQIWTWIAAIDPRKYKESREEVLARYRETRGIAFHAFCVLIVGSPAVTDLRILSGIAMTVALKHAPVEGFPATGETSWIDVLGEDLNKETIENSLGYFYQCEQNVMRVSGMKLGTEMQ